MGRFRNWFFIGLLILLFAEVLIVFPLKLGRHSDDEAPVSAEDAKELSGPGPAEQKMGGVHLVESQKGARDWELFAEEAEGNQGKGNWNLKKMKVLYYNNEKIEFTVLGDEGSVDPSRDMRVRGNVTTTSANGYVFKTQEIFYDSKTRRITSPSRVLMQGPADGDGSGMKVTGARMVVEVDTSKMTIPADVRAERTLKNGKRVGVVSDAAEFSGRNKQARFIGNVVMDYDRARLEGPEAAFFQSDKGDFLSNVRFSGGVKVSDVDKFATSENLNLDLLANKFIFTGRPKVYQNNDELSGEQIIFLEGGKKVRVEKVRARSEKAP